METMMPSLHSAGTLPVHQTEVNNLTSSWAVVWTEYFSSSAVILSDPAERPFLSLPMALRTSSSVGASTGILLLSVASEAALPRSGQDCAGGWLSAVE